MYGKLKFPNLPTNLDGIDVSFFVEKSTCSFFKIVDLNCEFLEKVRSFDCLLAD